MRSRLVAQSDFLADPTLSQPDLRVYSEAEALFIGQIGDTHSLDHVMERYSSLLPGFSEPEAEVCERGSSAASGE